MIDAFLKYDEALLIYLNNLGSITFDGFWLFITNQLNLLPFFLLIAWLFYHQMGAKKLLLLLVVISLMIAFTDQFTNLIKNATQRLRPIHEPHVRDLIRIVKNGGLYSFFSGHASNSMAFAVLLFILLKRHYKYMAFIFIFPFVFAYSRVYLGLHYPLDIIVGFGVGSVVGYLTSKGYHFLEKKLNFNP